jgi:hypothetical protein
MTQESGATVRINRRNAEHYVYTLNNMQITAFGAYIVRVFLLKTFFLAHNFQMHNSDRKRPVASTQAT